MVYFVADSKTYLQVAFGSLHALPSLPLGLHDHELVLLGEKRHRMQASHRQVQYLAKVLHIREAAPGELEKAFPESVAEHDWRWVIELYWSAKLDHPFNLNEIPGLDYAAYRNVETARRLAEPDERVVFEHLLSTNKDLLLAFLNRADPEERRAVR